jgi:hypothetical protein
MQISTVAPRLIEGGSHPMRTIDRVWARATLFAGWPIEIRTGYFAALTPLLLSMALFWPFNRGTKVPMSTAEAVPAARGMVVVHKGDNGDTGVDTKVKSLANPVSLKPPEDVYIVWFQPDGKMPIKEGALKIDKHFEGELKTETPYQRFKVIVTAEKDAQVKTPGGPRILTANVAYYPIYMNIPHFIY